MFQFFKHIRAINKIKKLPFTQRRLIFYSEGPDNWPHFERIIAELLKIDQSFVYYTSHPNDPGLFIDSTNVKSVCIGDKTARTILFSSLEADMVLMTMPDLNTFHIKRSQLVKHYAYVHHSMVSQHMIYRKHAFDNFDSILCVGPHHKAEICEMENLYKLARKICIKHGYGRLDTLLENKPNQKLLNNPKKVLVAPSWGSQGVIEKYAFQTIKPLLDAGFSVIVRPHPITRKKASNILNELIIAFGSMQNFRIEENVSDINSLIESDVMISDWSGVALEFAFSMEKPVIFIDVPKKILNEDYQNFEVKPLEISIREKIGRILKPQNLKSIASIVNEISDDKYLVDSIRQIKNLYVYNIGNSALHAKNHILNVLNNTGN